MESETIAKWIDHTLLKVDCTEEEVKKVCQEAIDYGFKTVCIYPRFLPVALEMLKGKKPIPITVIDFPKGEASIEEKVNQAKMAVSQGAKEIDMVMNYQALKKGYFEEVFEGIQAVVKAASPYPVKVILETCFLSHDEIVIASTLSRIAGAAFLKTSTGFGSKGASLEEVHLMRRIAGKDMGVKASGGIRTRLDAMKMIEAGATRLGTSSSISLLEGEK